MVSRVPRATLRRTERLARHAHAFHRFAHHPLCEAYAGEVFRIGRARVCKGCSLAMLGGVVGVAAAGIVRLMSAKVSMVVPLAALVLGVGCLLAARRWRSGKLASRFVPALLLSACVTLSALRFDVIGAVIALTAVAIVPIVLWEHRKRGPWREPCRACAEGLDGDEVCSGFRRQLRREKAVMRLSARWIAEATQPRPRGEG